MEENPIPNNPFLTKVKNTFPEISLDKILYCFSFACLICSIIFIFITFVLCISLNIVRHLFFSKSNMAMFPFWYPKKAISPSSLISIAYTFNFFVFLIGLGRVRTNLLSLIEKNLIVPKLSLRIILSSYDIEPKKFLSSRKTERLNSSWGDKSHIENVGLFSSSYFFRRNNTFWFFDLNLGSSYSK